MFTDKVEQEIEAFYDEYPDERLRGDHVDRIHHKYEQKTLGRKSFTESGSESGVKLYSQSDFDNSSRVLATDITKPIVTNEIDSNIHVSFKANSINNSNNESMSSSNWPKFDDILLEMGKQYDWKNDRWIKVKEKIRESRPRKVIEDKNNVEFHERHKFSYKIVKLNRSKSRKNVVVAVSAVR